MNNEVNQTQQNPNITPNTPKVDAPQNNEVVDINVMDGSSGINLVPLMSKEEIVKEEKKQKLNKSSIIIITVLIIITSVVVGFNIVARTELNSAKKKLSELEEEVSTYSEKIKSNDEILDRIFLYKEIEGMQFSSKAVVEYISGVGKKSGNINLVKFDFSGKESINFEGTSDDLESVAKFWYLLNNDENFENMSMDTISKNASGIRFSFSGKILSEKFLKSE